MLNIGTFSIGFPDGKLFFVGHKEDINELINYYDNREPDEKLDIYEVIYIVVKNNMRMCVMEEDDHLGMLKRVPILKERHLLISMDAYMEALCFSDIGRKEVKKLLPITDKEIDEIIKVSLWNKIL